jgi:hypothetical protein
MIEDMSARKLDPHMQRCHTLVTRVRALVVGEQAIVADAVEACGQHFSALALFGRRPPGAP